MISPPNASKEHSWHEGSVQEALEEGRRRVVEGCNFSLDDDEEVLNYVCIIALYS
jgi:hypothetical protein